MVSISVALIAAIVALSSRLDHAVELERLARGQPQRAVGVARRDVVERQPLRRRAHAARQPRADHEAVGGLELLAAALVAHVAVVLLVAAVELDQHACRPRAAPR